MLDITYAYSCTGRVPACNVLDRSSLAISTYWLCAIESSTTSAERLRPVQRYKSKGNFYSVLTYEWILVLSKSIGVACTHNCMLHCLS